MNKIIFITGMAGAGKSTIGRLLARHFTKSLFIQVDELREKMLRGYAGPEDGVFSRDARQQFRLARVCANHMAQLYADEGVNVVIDDVCVPANFSAHYSALFERPHVHRVLLFPQASVVQERIRQRGGPLSHIDHVPAVYRMLEAMPKDGWIVLDSSELTVAQTLAEVLSRVQD